MGRPTKLTDKLQEDLVQRVSDGLFVSVACQAVGIHDSTFRRWMASPAPRYRAFQSAITQARAKAEGDALREIRSAMRTDWRAAAWYLERRLPHIYGPMRLNPASWGHVDPERVDAPQAQEAPAAVPFVAAGMIQIDPAMLTPDQLRAIVKQIEEGEGDVIDADARPVEQVGGDPAPSPG